MRDSKGRYVATHGKRKTKLYRIWCAMKERCNNPHNKSYQRYGKRGIKVCDEWNESFEAFEMWAIQSGYQDGLTIDRVDNSKGYSAENCRWATVAEQNRNYSRNHMITYQGETKCLSDWADQFGIKRATVLFRLKSGKSLEEAFRNIDGRSLRWKTIIS